MGFFALVFLIVSPISSAKVCDAETLKAQCGEWSQREGDTLTIGGKTFPNPAKAKSKSVIESGKPMSLDEQNKEFDRLFKIVRKAMLDEILQGRNKDSLPESQRAMYDRINTLRTDGVVNTSCEGAGGIYVRERHAVSLCPASFQYPEITVLGLLSHEFAHAIDPCTVTLPLFDVNSKKAKKLSDSKKYKAEIEGFEGRADILSEIMNAGGMMGTVLWGTEDRKDFSYMVDNKLIKGVAIKPTELENYPFLGAMECLKGLGFKSNTTEKYNKWIREKAEGSPEQKKRYEAFSKRHAECMIKKPKAPQTQMSEMMADLWRAKIMGRILAQDSSAENARAGMAVDLFEICQPEQFPFKGKGDISGDIKHPPSEQRVLHALLRHPQFAEALGCDLPAERTCVSKLTDDLKGSATSETVAPKK